MVGAIAGAFLMAYLRNRCTVVGWENYVQEIIVGHIIIVAGGRRSMAVAAGVMQARQVMNQRLASSSHKRRRTVRRGR